MAVKYMAAPPSSLLNKQQHLWIFLRILLFVFQCILRSVFILAGGVFPSPLLRVREAISPLLKTSIIIINALYAAF